jgi:hypothetical protein
MRLFEVAGQFVDDLETVLRIEIGKNNSGHSSKTVSWQALSNMLEPFGYGQIDFDGFKRIYFENPSIHSLVKNYSKDVGVVLGTSEDPKSDQTQTPIPTGPSVDQMAAAGAKKLQPDI